MGFSSWLGKRLRAAPRRPSHGSRGKRSTYRPRLEALEDRWLPSQIGLTVTSLADAGPGTLRAAILAADAGSHSDKFTIGFGVTGAIDLQSPLPDLANSIAIQGPGASTLTVERAAGASLTSAIVTVDSGQTASLSGLTIANGNAGGILNNGTLTVANCAVRNNSGSLVAVGGTISGTAPVPAGGGIYSSGTLTVSDSAVSGNSALYGGGICSSGTLTVSGGAVSGNFGVPFFDPTSGLTFQDIGGGIYSAGAMTLSGAAISGNTTETFGGGIIALGPGTITNSMVSGNSAGSAGGGIYVGGSLAISNSQLSGNSAVGGGGIYNDGGTLTLSTCAFTKNSATAGGGAILNVGGTTVRDSKFSNNTANFGAGILNGADGPLDVRGSSFTNNTASDSGGAIYNLGTATLQLSTLSGNTAGSDGGGIFNGASGTLAVKDSTVLNNVAPSGADIYNLGALALDDSTVGVLGP
jgi:predicted outer membrane repeat protein